MMKTTAFKSAGVITLLAISALIALSSCTKGTFGNGGKQIKFATISGGSQSTKTAYGVDATVDGVKKQSIDWVEGDAITITSPQAEVTNSPGVHKSNYVIKDITKTGVLSKATVENEGTNGLAWLDEDPDGGYSFFAVYPKEQEGIVSINPANGLVTATVPASQTNTKGEGTKDAGEGDDKITYTVYEPDMNLAFMTAAKTGAMPTDETVSLEFNPAFTAFEFNVSSKDEDVEITEIQLVADSEGNDYLSGAFTMTAGNLASYAASGTQAKTATLKTTVTETVDGVETQTGVTVTTTEGASFTLFTLPKANAKALKLRVTSKDDDGTKTGYVMMTYATAGQDLDAETMHAAGDPVVFLAGHKYRINMLKLEGSKWKYALDLGGKVLEWDYVEESTTFSENVQAKAFSFGDGCYLEYDTETYPKSNHYEAYDTGTNSEFKTWAEWNAMGDGQAAYNAAHPTYYQLYYQLRTLNMDVTKPRFDIEFTPTEPLGGYYNLTMEDAPSYGSSAQGGKEGFKIVRWDGESELDNWSSGQIMNQKISLRIYPSENRDPSKEYCMIIKGYFSPNKNGEPTYSADSELQDVHGDGRYSYWKFVIPATE